MQFFSWVASNWQTICGWAAGLYLLYRVGFVITAVVIFFTTSTARFKNAETTLNLVATNHLPHIQAELEKSNSTLEALREDIRLVILRKFNDREDNA